MVSAKTNPLCPRASTCWNISPRSIPADAESARFYYITPPGDLDMELSCVLPEADVAALVGRIESKALVAARGSEQLSAVADGELSLPCFYVYSENNPKLPSEFTIYVMGIARSAADSDGTSWSYEYGVAVNRSTREVIYWLQGVARGPATATAPSPSKK